MCDQIFPDGGPVTFFFALASFLINFFVSGTSPVSVNVKRGPYAPLHEQADDRDFILPGLPESRTARN